MAMRFASASFRVLLPRRWRPQAVGQRVPALRVLVLIEVGDARPALGDERLTLERARTRWQPRVFVGVQVLDMSVEAQPE